MDDVGLEAPKQREQREEGAEIGQRVAPAAFERDGVEDDSFRRERARIVVGGRPDVVGGRREMHLETRGLRRARDRQSVGDEKIGTYKGSLTGVGNLYHSTFTYPRILDIPGFSTFKRGVFTPGFGCRN